MPAILGAFAQPPQQRLNTIHFAMAILVLILTVYPYLFNSNKVAALQADYSNLKHQSISAFDIRQADDFVWSTATRSRYARDTSEQEREQLLHASLSHRQQSPFDFQNELSQDAIEASAKLTTVRRIKFSSLGRDFNLILDRKIYNSDVYLTTKGFSVVTLDSDGKETIVPYDSSDIQILNGYVDGEPKSLVTASLNRQDKLLTAQIKTGSQLIIIEPTYLHRDQLFARLEPAINTTTETPLPNSLIGMNYSTKMASEQTTTASLPESLYSGTMIVYNLRDHRHFQETPVGAANSSIFDLGSLCGAVKVDAGSSQSVATDQTIEGLHEARGRGTRGPSLDKDTRKLLQQMNPPDEQIDIDNVSIGTAESIVSRHRNRRSIEIIDTGRDKTRCTLHLVADYLFYKHVGNGDIQTTINYLLALVNRVNLIYLPTIWETGEENGESFRNIGFTVQNITIHQEHTRSTSNGDDIHYNMAGDRLWGAREFLDNFSKNSPPRQYCLAHLFTYRQFDTPVLGLAYVASPRLGAIGGICSQIQQKGDFLYKHNTGISTSKGISGETLITRQTDLVVAHELGHNFGAEHDSNECRPTPSKGGAFLMHPFAVLGFEKNNRFLSNCSRLSIGRVLKRKASTCFVQVANNVCGNGIVEGDEQCDGGDLGYGHRDPCCDSLCRFTPGSLCSDRHSWCCNKCRIELAGVTCRQAEELNCKQSSYCDGMSAECPPSPPIEDNKTCIAGGFCRAGDCVPFCEANNLLSCMCNTPANACRLCCKTSVNGTCEPYDMQKPFLPDGNQCYRGICEKGRCEQPIQDVVERLWDVIEDITLTTFVKFLRDNIIFVVLVCSIPIWCLCSYYINEFDRRVKQDVKNATRNKERQRPSPFMPHLFVADDLNNSDSALNDKGDPMSRQPLRPKPRKLPESHHQGDNMNNSRHGSGNSGGSVLPPPHQPGFIHRVSNYGFRLPEGEDVVFGPGNHSIALNSIELPHLAGGDLSNNGASYNIPGEDDVHHAGSAAGHDLDDDDEDLRYSGPYSTQV